ncbi:MAG TPA: aldose epimerase family protein [Anaeromyxobacteraceae bacterium]|nr:aldose epimerase family protein [Anaeromyxobacteraceae bacterium]
MPGTVDSRTERRPGGDVPLEAWTLRNAAGWSVEVLSHGGIVSAVWVPDRAGVLDDVVLGHASLGGWLGENRPYFGALVGRYANRIARGELTLDGEVHRLFCNDGQNHLHGGRRGFDKQPWAGTPRQSGDRVGVLLRRRSPHGEEGYPGNLDVEAGIALTGAGELVFEVRATTDRPTVVNLCHHGYFDLDCGADPDVLGHLLTVDASRFTPVGPGLIPTGELRPVAGTPFDFRRPTPLGANIGDPDPQLWLAGGYDHNWVLDRPGLGGPPAARLEGRRSGRVLEVFTTEPGLQVYTGNFLDGTIPGKRGRPCGHRAGVTLETQHFPDSPHQPAFPTTVLRPGESYRTTTVYRFSVA